MVANTSASQDVVPSLKIIDTDTHLTEPMDLWTARIPVRFRSRAPRG